MYPEGKANTNQDPLSLLQFFEAPLHSSHRVTVEGIVFTDNGSTLNFIRNSTAHRLGLQGVPYSYCLRVVDSEYSHRETMKYEVGIGDNRGQIHWIEAIGIDVITDTGPVQDTSEARRVLPQVPAEAFNRPHGQVDLLIGLANMELHPIGETTKGHLRVCGTIFGCGKIVTGSHTREDHRLSPAAQAIANSLPTPPPEGHAFFLSAQPAPLLGFQEAEDLGCTPAPLCESCKGCRDCSLQRRTLTPQEAEIVSRVEREMVLDKDQSTLHCQYPWKACASRMRDNWEQANKVQGQIERRLIKTNQLEQYNEEMEKAIQAGTVRELTDSETKLWKGPVNYNTVFPVFNKESQSTKVRIVLNSALPNVKSGLSLNDCMWAGPNALAMMIDVLLHWRTIEVAIVWDIKKAYQALRTGEKELHLRRFLWRKRPSDPWRVYGYTRVTFGDVAAGLLLEVGKRRAAKEGWDTDPKAAEQIKEKTYVDDGVAGGSKEDA